MVSAPPLGLTQWESEQLFPLGFNTLDNTDNGGVLCPSEDGQTGLEFRHGDTGDQTFTENEEEKPLELDNPVHVTDSACGDVHLEGDNSIIPKTSPCSTRLEEFSFIEKTTGATETLKWLFSPSPSDAVGETSSSEKLDLVLPSKTSDTIKGDPFLLVDLLANELSCLPVESSGELNPQGVSGELVDLSQEEQADTPPSQSRETLSPETGDKGLCSDQVTDLPVTCSTTLRGSPENCLPHNHISTPLESLQGSVPLLDLEVPDCESSLSLCPVTSPSVVCTGEPLYLLTEELQVEHEGATEIRDVTSEQPGENDSFALGLSAEGSSLTVPQAEDAFTKGGLSVENELKDLMGDEVCTQGNEAMALDPCLTADEVQNKETWDLKPQEGVQDATVTNLTPEPKEEEPLTDTKQLEGSDHHDVVSLGFPDQDLHNSSSEAGWTSEQTVETISLAKMVGNDSLPMVSAVNSREEDVSPLKAVFDALDQDGDGFVRIEEFMEFAAAYGADQVRSLPLFCSVPAAAW